MAARLSLVPKGAPAAPSDLDVIRSAQSVLRDLTTPTNEAAIDPLNATGTAKFNEVKLAAAGFSDWRMAAEVGNTLLLGEHAILGDVKGLECASIRVISLRLAERILAAVS